MWWFRDIGSFFRGFAIPLGLLTMCLCLERQSVPSGTLYGPGLEVSSIILLTFHCKGLRHVYLLTSLKSSSWIECELPFLQLHNWTLSPPPWTLTRPHPLPLTFCFISMCPDANFLGCETSNVVEAPRLFQRKVGELIEVVREWRTP